jgi:nifR3 family TIM-barrel protein
MLTRPPLAIGPHLLDGAAVLAPMSGITDAGFRRVARRFGASLVVSEMVASEELVRGQAEAALRAEGCGLGPHMVQLAGCEARWMGEAARLAEANGADIIDINMGCPAKRVANRQSGSALMRDLDHAAGLIEATIAAVRVPVTVKMRLGWDDASLNAPELARRAVALGACMITVHGRTRAMFYQGNARWAEVAPVVQKVQGTPVLVNGDITDAATARAALAASGAAGVMLGRAALGRPWLVGEVAAALAGRPKPARDPATLAAAAVEHVESVIAAMGEATGIRHVRKHLAAYADEAARLGSAEALRLKPALLATSTLAEATRLLAACFETLELKAA